MDLCDLKPAGGGRTPDSADELVLHHDRAEVAGETLDHAILERRQVELSRQAAGLARSRRISPSFNVTVFSAPRSTMIGATALTLASVALALG